MEADGDLYDIKRFPSVYYYMVLKFAVDILFVFKADELEKSEDSAKEFKKVPYIWLAGQNQSVNQEVLKRIATDLLETQGSFVNSPYQGRVAWEDWTALRAKSYFKFIARLELYGAICKAPHLLKVDCRKDNEIDISFLSACSKSVLKRARCLRSKDGQSIIYLDFYRFNSDWFDRECSGQRSYGLKRKDNGMFEVKRAGE